MSRFIRFKNSQKASGIVEYILITALIAIAAIAFISRYGHQILIHMGQLSVELSGGELRHPPVSETDCVPRDRLDSTPNVVFDSRVQRYRHTRTGKFTKIC